MVGHRQLLAVLVRFLLGPVTDALVALAEQAAAGVTVNGKPVQVSDGGPDELTFGMFVVGLSDTPPEAQTDTMGTRHRVTIGAYIVTDELNIPCYIDVIIPGRSQKAARDAASALFDEFWSLIAADPSLGGVLEGGSAQVTSMSCLPENRGSVAEPARRQLISFVVACTSTHS